MWTPECCHLCLGCLTTLQVPLALDWLSNVDQGDLQRSLQYMFSMSLEAFRLCVQCEAQQSMQWLLVYPIQAQEEQTRHAFFQPQDYSGVTSHVHISIKSQQEGVSGSCSGRVSLTGGPPGASPPAGELVAGTLLPDGTDPVCEGPACRAPRCQPTALAQESPSKRVLTQRLIPVGLAECCRSDFAVALSGCQQRSCTYRQRDGCRGLDQSPGCNSGSIRPQRKVREGHACACKLWQLPRVHSWSRGV